MSSRLSLDSSLGQFPPSKFKQLCMMLRQNEVWMELASVIRTRDNSAPRFTTDDVLNFEMCADPAQMLLNAWSTDFVTFRSLISCLEEARLLRAAEFVREIVGDSRIATPAVVSAVLVNQRITPEIPPSGLLLYSVLGKWTNNFDMRSVHSGGNLLGQGGYADVFRGCDSKTLRQVAVKRLKISVTADDDDHESHTPRQQFENEITVLTGCDHTNVVRLVGCSTDGPFRCIVYEYMSGGSLDDRLTCRYVTEPLSAVQRLSIGRDTVRGIAYLHTEKKLIHMDIKSANILLDEAMRAKVSDYGITRRGSSTPGKTSTQTQFIIGTTAYMAPELLTSGRVSEKVDAYSFGVVLLELLTGLPVFDPDREDPNLVMHISENCGDEITPMLDRRAGHWDCIDPEQIFRLALRLTSHMHKLRPKITEIQDEVETWTRLCPVAV